MSMFRVMIGTVLLAVLAACGSPATQVPQQETQVLPDQTTSNTPTPENPLINTEWTLVRFEAGGQQTPLVDNTALTAIFRDTDRLEGSGGCNGYFANYVIEENRISIEQPGRTEIGCAEPITRQETEFLEALTTAETYHVSGDTLTISYQGGQLVFQSKPEAASPPLLETTWQLTTFEEGSTAFSSIDGTRVTLQLTNGIAGGNAGCNSYGGGYTIEGQQIKINEIASTQMACIASGIMEQETRYLTTLGAVTSWAIEGETLILSHPGGALRFAVAPRQQ